MSRAQITAQPSSSQPPVRLAVIWIDWYPYHVARFRGLESHPELARRVAGLELVGGVGVHAGLKFREPLPPELAVQTLRPDQDWAGAGKLRLAFDLWRALTRLAPAAVLVPGYYTLPGIAAALWARVHHRRSILMSESAEQDHSRSPFRERLKSFLLRTLFDGAVVGGTVHRQYLSRLGFPMDAVAGSYDVVDNAYIVRAVADARAAGSSSGPSSPFFLYVGRLAAEKNVSGLLQAWLRYRENGGTWGLVLAGDGPERGALESTAGAHAHGSAVTFTGLRSAAQLIPLWAAAGCFVLPSTREPWGLVVNEAMAASLPVLVSRRCGAAADLVQEAANGFTFDPVAPRPENGAGPDPLAALLHDMEQMPAAQRQRMGACSLERIRGLSPETFGSEVATLLQKLNA